jgi:hypothetical protein
MITKIALKNLSLASELSVKMQFPIIPSTIPYEYHNEIQKWMADMARKAEENANAYAEEKIGKI